VVGSDGVQKRCLKILFNLYNPFVTGMYFENLLEVQTKKNQVFARWMCLIQPLTRSITRDNQEITITRKITRK
jgi:hypothetical protein